MCRWMYVHFKLISKIFLTLEDALACWSSCRSRIFTCKLAEYTRSSSFIISSKISFSTWCTTSETKFELLSGWGAPVVDTNRNSSLSFNLNSEKEKTEYKKYCSELDLDKWHEREEEWIEIVEGRIEIYINNGQTYKRMDQ